MSGGMLPANKYKYFAYVDLKHPVIARHTLFSSGPNMSAYVDLAHTGAAYSAIEWYRAVVFIVLAFVPYFDVVGTFILVFCMCCL